MPVRVVGYAYQADTWCTDCMTAHARARLAALCQAAPARASAEDLLTAWANAVGLAYPTEASDAHDTNDFPFPILSGTEDAEGRCSQADCGQALLG